MSRSYSYNPAEVGTYGKDRMRFELGDIMTEGGAETSALCDEEYNAVISVPVHTERQWKKLKLRCLESIMRRFMYEPDTKVGPLSLDLGERADRWRKMYDELKADLDSGAASASSISKLVDNPKTGDITPPYFWNGMMSHEEAEGQDI